MRRSSDDFPLSEPFVRVATRLAVLEERVPRNIQHCNDRHFGEQPEYEAELPNILVYALPFSEGLDGEAIDDEEQGEQGREHLRRGEGLID